MQQISKYSWVHKRLPNYLLNFLYRTSRLLRKLQEMFETNDHFNQYNVIHHHNKILGYEEIFSYIYGLNQNLKKDFPEEFKIYSCLGFVHFILFKTWAKQQLLNTLNLT